MLSIASMAGDLPLRLFSDVSAGGILEWLGTTLTNPLLLGLLMAAVGAFLGALAARDLLRRRAAMQAGVFRHLALKLGLGWSDRRLVRRAALHAGVPSPAALLISRGCFDFAAQRCGDVSERDLKRLNVIRRQVFADGHDGGASAN
jgi:hypothetical protein